VDTLAVVVSAMAEAVRDSFAAMGLPLPPWREGRALVSKWLPDDYQDTAVPRRPASLLLLPPGSLAQSRSSRGSCSGARARRELPASRRSSAGAGVAAAAARAGDGFQPARVVTGFAVAPKWCGGGGEEAAGGAAGGAGAGRPGGQAAAVAVAGQARAAANRDRLAQLLPPMRTVRLGA
jgi:hypothetical protein